MMKFANQRAAVLCVVAVAALSLSASSVWSDDSSDVPGEAVLSTPFAFVKFTVNGKSEWENHTYTKGNKTVMIMGLARDQENVIVLTPRVPGYEPVTVTIAPEQFKRRRLRGKRLAVYRFSKRIKFRKEGAAEKGKPQRPGKGAKKTKAGK